ncbi:MAG: flavin reductase family protein [Bacteroidota bacterium]
MNSAEQHISQEGLQQMNSRKRGLFMNSLAGYRPVILVGTVSNEGVANLAIFNSLIHFGADPALWGLVCRPNAQERDTVRNISANGKYTLNFIHVSERNKAHQTSAKYPASVSEFDACGFETTFKNGCIAPFVQSAIVKMEMEAVMTIPIPLNGTSILIGKPINIQLPDGLVGQDGFADLAGAGVLGCQGLDAYLSATVIERLPYAQP